MRIWIRLWAETQPDSGEAPLDGDVTFDSLAGKPSLELPAPFGLSASSTLLVQEPRRGGGTGAPSLARTDGTPSNIAGSTGCYADAAADGDADGAGRVGKRED